TLYVYGKRAVGSNGVFGPQDFRYCALSSIGPNCVQRHQMLDTTTRWVSITVSPTYERSGRYVRGYVQALWGTISVGKLRLHLQYGILK
ncbi:MAG TPA: hypothetical protein VFJ71_01260, partial [Candidatus Limnocylindrales bacterium]|nr:hypothetical protein [Candidatus Limnocylindrales bacterium]